MKIITAPDKFKGTFSSSEIAEIIYDKIKAIHPEANIVKLPLADGGEGSAEIFSSFFDARPVTVKVFNPVFKQIEATFYVSEKNNTAFIDLSAASGLEVTDKKYRNPMHTSSYGTGQLILEAIKTGAENIYVFLGGSAVNDAACGAAEALGYVFYDKKGNIIKQIKGKDLINICKINSENTVINPDKVKFTVFCDVKNKLYGKNGAAFVFAKQKGAGEKDISHLDKGLKNLSEIIKKQYKTNIGKTEGSGAAGGFAGGSIFFLNALLKSGAKTFLEISDFDNLIKDTDLVITGEGKFDKQSLNGKITGTVIEKTTKNKIKTIVICGLSEININNELLKIYPLFEKYPGDKNIKKVTEKRTEEIIKNIIFKPCP